MQLTFAASYFAYLLFLLPLVALLRIFADAHARRVVALFVSSERLRPSLLEGTSLWWLGLHFGLQILGLAFMIIALTRPQMGMKEEDIPNMGRDVFIAIDCSKSMLSDDMTPNRLTRAKLAAQDLLEKLQGDRVALVAFAGRSFLQAPLTTDHDAVRESIQALDYTTIPRGGSSLASAIDLVLETVDKMPAQHHGMILFSDGQETDNGTVAAAKRAKDKHLLILPVGMGTAEGSLIPDPDPDRRGEYIRDERGLVKTKLESALLQEIAAITGGRYVELASQPLTQQIVDDLTLQLDRQSRDSRHESHPIERYQWPLCVGVLCCILSLLMRPLSRRTLRSPALPVEPQAEVHVHAAPAAVPAVTLLCCLLMVTQVGAAGFSDIKKAQKDYEDGRFDQARETYRKMLRDEKPAFDRADLSYGLASTDRSLKDYDGAVQAYSDALKSDNPALKQRALRGLASSLYDWGDERLPRDPETAMKAWVDSIDHFESEMKLLPKDSAEYKEVRENRDFVQKRLDEVEKQTGKKVGRKKQKMQSADGASDEDEDEDAQGKPQPQQKKSGDQDKEEKDRPNQPARDKEHDTLKKSDEKEMIPEGDLKAMEDAKRRKGLEEEKRALDEFLKKKYGFTEEEARQQLRNYADDQKTGDQRSLQYLQRRGEPPVGGKDY